MVTIETITWQNKTVAAKADFRGVRLMGLFAAWAFFFGLLFLLPPFAAAAAKAPPLLRAVIGKGLLMPDLGLMVAGFCAFHFNRQLRHGWDGAVAWRLMLHRLLPVLAYTLLALLLFEVASILGGREFARPWAAPLFAPLFPAVMTAVVCALLLPLMAYWFWTAVMDVVLAIFVITWVYYGAQFTIGFHGLPWMNLLAGLVDFLCGAAACSLVFRGAEYFVVVRGHMMLIGLIALIAGSILETASLLTLGLLLMLAGAALSERTSFLPGEAALLAWSRSAPGIALLAPAVLLAWESWGSHAGLPLWLAAAGLALVTQIFGAAAFLLVEPPLRPVFQPGKA